ncbi:MAG: thrombospondin type 3 repeat-containing protein, partial [Verrucomicrobiales bacterium]|nr:thrombospondin type 3 repeat-containing protein [Verrucomicrobiales bacterium]
MNTLLRLASVALITPLLAHAVDFDNNGYDDIWESLYASSSLDPTTDTDGDGCSNLDESLAGTDPRDPDDCFTADHLEITPAKVLFEIPTETGKLYQFESNTELAPNGWQAVGTAFTGTGHPLPLTAPRSTTNRFFRVTVTDQDTDADSISDWAELQLARFSPTSGQSASLGTSDADTLRSLLSITASVEVLDAYEKENATATVRVTRTFGTMPLHLYFNTGGDPDPTKGSATTADYNLRNGTTGAFFSPGAVTFPAGSTTLDIHVHPKTDTATEVPETLSFDFLADLNLPNKPTTSAAVRINDATPVPENNQLFVAYLNPVPGTASSGSGIATVLVRGDNAIGDINISFNNLTSLQTAGHIHVANPATGPEIHNFGVGQLSGE